MAIRHSEAKMNTPCTCGGKDDGLHSSHCDRRQALQKEWQRLSNIEDDKWEYVGNDTWRLFIGMGWLVQTVLSEYKGDGSAAGGVHMLFIPGSLESWR